MSSSLYRGGGADKPTLSLTPWSHLAALVNSQGEIAKLNWHAQPLTMNQRYFHAGLAMGTCKYASGMSMDIVHLLSLMDDLTDAWVSILNCGMTRWPFRWERCMTGHRSPVFFGTRKETAEEILDFWMEHWLDCPFGLELVHITAAIMHSWQPIW